MGGSSRSDREYSVGSSSRRARQDDAGSSFNVVGEVGREFANRYGVKCYCLKTYAVIVGNT